MLAPAGAQGAGLSPAGPHLPHSTMSGCPTASAASAGSRDNGLVARAAHFCVKYDVHQGKMKPLLPPESVIVDPEDRSGMLATENEICGHGEKQR